MTQLVEKAKKVLESTPEHILEARSMASAIYKKEPLMHVEMLSEIKRTLVKLHEKNAENIDGV